jgi:signal transduction histidine kinase
MADPFACPVCGSDHPAFRVMNEAVLAIAAERSVEPVLRRMVDAARELAGGRYAALGIPDGAGGFAQFIASGITDDQSEAIGRLPRTHGLLGAMLEDPAPFRIPDVRRDPRFRGWPSKHPAMKSFLGVPIVSRGAIIGALYLTDKEGAPEFDATDQKLVEMLATHAAIAIENARLSERSAELTVMQERNRLARELHDSVTQTLFSAVYTAEAAATLLERDPSAAAAEVRDLQRLSRQAVQEMRSLIFELRPAELESDGLVPTLRKHVEVLRRVYGAEVELCVKGDRRLPVAAERELFRVTQEALQNSLKHARATAITVELRTEDHRTVLTVSDDGIGFDPHAPHVRSRHLGLTSMEERAQSLGGHLGIRSAPGEGTVVRMEVPVAG